MGGAVLHAEHQQGGDQMQPGQNRQHGGERERRPYPLRQDAAEQAAD